MLGACFFETGQKFHGKSAAMRVAVAPLDSFA